MAFSSDDLRIEGEVEILAISPFQLQVRAERKYIVPY